MFRRGFRLTWAFSAAAVLFSACSENPTSHPDPTPEISDGAHAGNNNFFFLAPMVANPSPTGTFDGSLHPEVEICVWNGADCDALLAIFDVNTGPGSETIRVESDHYVVNWHTDDILNDFPLDEGETYRIRVLVGGHMLGFADVEVVGSAKELKNVETDELIPLKDGRTLPIKFRIEVGALASARTVSSGQSLSCALAPGGQAYCWGRNDLGGLGIGTVGGPGPAGSYNTPQLVAGGHTFQSVHANTFNGCGLRTDGKAYCWGLNQLGQMGIGAVDGMIHPTPEPVSGGHTFVSLRLNKTNRSHACGVTETGEMYCWGYNNHGQIGTGAVSFSEPAPVKVSGHTFSEEMAPGREFTCAVTAVGEALCWGFNARGNLGNGVIDGADYLTPSAVVGSHQFNALVRGLRHVCGTKTSGQTVCWGLNNKGQLGDGTFIDNGTPQLVLGGHTFTRLGAGLRVVCGIRPDGETLCWGRNQFGQLGRGFADVLDVGEPSPGLVVGGHTFAEIDSGSGWTCGKTTAAEVSCWGRNSAGYLGDGTNINTVVPQLAIGF